MANETAKVSSLVKAIKVLECFSMKNPELGVTEIAKQLGLQKSTVHNILSTFETMGYLIQNPTTGKYSLGVRLLQFSYIINNQMGYQKFFLPYMEIIAEKVHETVFLAIPHGNEVLYLESKQPHNTMGDRKILGEHAPMYCTGLGKALLAFMSPEEQLKHIPDTFVQFTENTLTSKEDLLEDLRRIRERGYSIDNMEHEYGVVCVALPIFGHDGFPVAAISISGPSLRLQKEAIVQAAANMKEILSPTQYVL